jgi:hypothetical protein
MTHTAIAETSARRRAQISGALYVLCIDRGFNLCKSAYAIGLGLFSGSVQRARIERPVAGELTAAAVVVQATGGGRWSATSRIEPCSSMAEH